MVQPIESAEVFGKATAVQGEAPKHTEAGHERCAYYSVIGPEGDDGTMMCQHGDDYTHIATGAFYSEDYLNELRRTAHRVIGLIDMRMPKGVWKNVHVERLRELTK